MGTVAELELVVQELADKVTSLLAQGSADGQCNAEFPHIGEMSYSAGRYLCRCGMRYSKDGRGGLREEN